jgi:hypothetical protein
MLINFEGFLYLLLYIQMTKVVFDVYLPNQHASSLQYIFVHFHHSCLKQTAYANNHVLYIRIVVLQEWSFNPIPD